MLPRFLLLLLLHAAIAIGDTAPLQQKPLLFTTADVWPWGYVDPEGAPTGLISQFAEQLAAAAELPLQNRVLPHQRVLAEVQRGQADFTVLFENPYLDDLADSVGVVLNSDILLVSNHSYTAELSLKALAGKTVGYIRGTYYGEAFEHDQSIIKIPVYNLDQAIHMLHIGRLEALISSDVVFHHSLLAQNLSADHFRYEILTSGHAAHLYMSRKASHAELRPAISAALEQMRESGELRRIFHSSLRQPAAD